MTKIVIVEDDKYLCEELIQTFRKKGYSASGISSFDRPAEAAAHAVHAAAGDPAGEAELAADGCSGAEQEILKASADLVILDVNLPGKSGYELCKWLKARASFPILILTARDTLSDELTALGLGADDFLTKPCHPDRLIARAERLLQTYGTMRSIIQAGSLSLDTSTCKLMWKNESLILPETEGKILQLLMEQHPELVPREEIFKAVWGSGEFVDENILQVNMTRLRKNLAGIGLEKTIKTVRGKGYVLEVNHL